MKKQDQQNSAKELLRKQYARMVEKVTPSSKLLEGCLRSFWVGGLICTLGQAFSDLGYRYLSLNSTEASTFGSMVLVFITALLTGIGIFDRIGKYAGAGTVVPITGFANAMVSPAMEYRPEGWVLGTGAKLFTIAGPVLVYGITASVAVGLIYCLIGG
ncbi:MAG: stage V sporulation protein AC [Clostridia bacterium]|nr:stage V sporulation protein AC [Clostridia bacterium]